MRSLAALLTTSLFSACTSMVMAEPRILVSPYLAVYQLHGKVAMQSQPTPGGPLQDNAQQPMRTFGQEHHHEDVGVRADIGDGFAGFRVDYYKIDVGTSHNGFLTADWGNMQQGDLVSMQVDGDELRIGYLEPLLHVRSTWRERPLSLQFAAGGVLAHRDINLHARADNSLSRQNVGIGGDVLYPAVRFQASWRDLAFDVDFALSPEIVLSGDFDGTQQDLEVRASYTLAMRDVTFFAGYRYSEFPAKGKAFGFAYDADLGLDGFQFGITVTF